MIPAPKHSISQAPVGNRRVVNFAEDNCWATAIAVRVCRVSSPQTIWEVPDARAMNMISWSCILQTTAIIVDWWGGESILRPLCTNLDPLESNDWHLPTAKPSNGKHASLGWSIVKHAVRVLRSFKNFLYLDIFMQIPDGAKRITLNSHLLHA